LFGLAWNVATFLVVPILAVEDVGPIEAVKRSTALLKRTWGEQIAGNLGIGAVFALLIVGEVFVGIAASVWVATLQSTALLILVICAFMLLILLTALFQSTLNGIYTAAVYQYAADGRAGTFFDPQLVQGAFRQQ
jgi:hypothetical protein